MWSDYGGVGNDYRGYDTDSVLQNHEHLPQDSNYQYSPAHHSNPMTINKEPPKEQPTYNNDSSTTEIIRYDDTILQALLWDNETAKPEPTPAKSSEANMQYLNYNGCKLMNQIAGEETQLQHNDQNTALEPSVGQGLDHNNWHSYDSTCSLSDTQQTSQFNIMDMNNCSCGVFNDDLDTFLMGQNAYIKSQQKKADVDAAESKPIYHPETQANPRFKKGRTANANIEYNPMFKDNIDFNHMTTTTVNVPTSRSLPIPGNRPPQDTKWTVGEIQRIIDNPTNPLGKFLRDTQISAEFAEHTNLMSFLTLAPRKKRQKYGARRNLTSQERQEQSKQRNRDHAHATRQRKKIFGMILKYKREILGVEGSEEEIANSLLQHEQQNHDFSPIPSTASTTSSHTSTQNDVIGLELEAHQFDDVNQMQHFFDINEDNML